MIRILLADDHRLVRAGLAQLLSGVDEFEVVGSAADGDEACRLAAELQPDIILMDLSMPGCDGIEATKRLRRDQPDARVLVLTSFSDQRRILEAIDAGAVGYLLKDTEPDDLIRAVRAAARDESPLDPRAAKALVEHRQLVPLEAQLTPREREVLGCIAEGLPNKLIARRLGIAEKTVKAHITNVFQRIGVSDRTQAALWARDNGIGAATTTAP
jgi:DNA-binding NarL/FixJ family response regulator